MNQHTGRLRDRNYSCVGNELFSDAMPHGDSVRVRKLGTPGFEEAPTAVYLVYIKLETNNSLSVRHMYRDTLVEDSVGSTHEVLFAEAKAGGGGADQVGSDFETMIFTGPTYFTIVLDNDDWDFYFPDPGREDMEGEEAQDPIVFIGRKVTVVERPGLEPERQETIYDPNTSFYDAAPVTVGDRKAVRCINFFRDAQSLPLVGQAQHLGFEILVRIPFCVSPAHDRKLVVIIDPDGQNQGPPVQ
jgi:hypothetical protein